MEQLREAMDRLEGLAYQRENNAVVALDLRDCKAIRTVLHALNEELREIHTGR
jgi:NADP-dependent 3-hydroxy acid dehydrogenase YdfG